MEGRVFWTGPMCWPPKSPLTDRQREVLDYVVLYGDMFGIPPSLTDIGSYFGFHINAAADHLKALERKKWIKRGPKLSKRTLTVMP